ncbi:MAG: hypothetical protein EKK35_22460 [Bradyrhizobiaceae bacterium]|jgi:hypothetical protein|uniref:Uncharacterized protein n=1 Tax=Syncephalis pseudoplumigaleata TaxID=1712513 RepID=A0A4P9Z7Y3_9FUNG|nr:MULTISPECIES: hypothetical protein [unclassified Afipia]MAH69188.1 hypothetical protein [Afipia sp.]OUX61730.1 MAG: hypothetical protein CBB64_08100 [Afipia sp. TMED4]RKP28041.1 hypothetical protein SYNPS1DRAFT_20597 [Syncephalis pseudoplumigaleata]RTL75474.1 MAG: hypothetical protein EKK35_22460 [Bradyrhizobiaceae bacterium]HAO40645.1 hypothetical protein [Afipia sp.]|eukprot:RKP28041.1 hypothetical protein SYNPS1DRAFT_20597 [Syncephalis pseudoplumigaleata]
MRAILALAILIGTAASAAADTGPLIVIPGRAGVPVMINGRDASYAVVEGEWGLAKHFKNADRVYGGWDRYIGPEVGHYYPSAGRTPGYGRLEIQPPANRALPQPAESYHRSWSAQSAPPAPQQHYDVPLYPPSIIEAPRDQSGRPNGFRPSYRPNGFRPDLKQ